MTTKAEKEKLWQKLAQEKRFLENNPVVIAWKKFITLPYSQQVIIRKEWNEYYNAKVKDSVVYAMFLEAKNAMGRNDNTRVKEIAEQVARMRKNGDLIQIAKPAGIDPWDFDYGVEVTSYKRLGQRLKELLDVSSIQEQNEVWS